MKKRTPGPWELCEEKDESLRKWIIMGPSQDPDMGPEPLAVISFATKPDAQLMTASREMLEALKAALDDYRRPDWRNLKANIARMEAAIAKAEGK